MVDMIHKMTVRDLIEELIQYNMDAEVTTPYSETIEIGYLFGEAGFTKLTTPLVFIRGSDYVCEDD